MLELIHIHETLKSYLGLQTFPVAVRMLETNSELSERYRGSQVKKIPMPICQGISLARRYGWKVVMGKAEMTCPVGALTMGFVSPNPRWMDGRIEVPYWVRDKEARRKILQNLAKLEFGKYEMILSAPLTAADFQPDLIVIYGNPAQIMRLVQSCIYLTGNPVLSASYGAAGCGTYITKAFVDNECKFVLSGAGDRIFAQTQDHEVCFSIPWSRIEEVLKGLQETHEHGMKYPICSFLRYKAELPRTYNELLAQLKSDNPETPIFSDDRTVGSMNAK